MPRLQIPSTCTIHTLKYFLENNNAFSDTSSHAVLGLHKNWAYMDPMALAMTAAWGGWVQRHGLRIAVDSTVGPHTNYASRMRLFEHLNIGYGIPMQEHEEAGRFVPVTRVRDTADSEAVMADVSALLHLDKEPDGLNAIRYCVSELIRNVLEHSGSPEGAFVCAQNYSEQTPKRVTVAVADCGSGIAKHLGRAYPAALKNDSEALRLAMQPGITGAQPGMYGAPDNAGAGLFITRAIAKSTGGYFVLLSGDAAFRLRRSRTNGVQPPLFLDAFGDPKTDKWSFGNKWQGTVATAEIMTDKIPNFPNLLQWIRKQLPATKTAKGKIKFT